MSTGAIIIIGGLISLVGIAGWFWYWTNRELERANDRLLKAIRMRQVIETARLEELVNNLTNSEAVAQFNDSFSAHDG